MGTIGRGKLKLGAVEAPTKCDICNRNRRSGNHQKCSKIRQAKYGHVVPL